MLKRHLLTLCTQTHQPPASLRLATKYQHAREWVYFLMKYRPYKAKLDTRFMTSKVFADRNMQLQNGPAYNELQEGYGLRYFTF